MAQARAREADPGTQLAQLASSVQAEGAPRAALLRGEERYFVERGLALLMKAATASGDEVCKHDTADPEFNLSMLLDDLGAAPLFAESRCIVVRGVDVLAKKVDKKNSPFTRTALAFLESEREGRLFLTGRSIRADHALAKAIKKGAGPMLTARKLFDSPPPWDPDPRKSELALWVRRRGGEVGVRLSPDDAAYIAAATGNDLSAIDTQLEKLRLGGGQALQELVGWDSGGNPWKVAGDLLGGDTARGLAGIEALFRSGFHSDRDGKTEVNPAALSAILFSALRGKARQALVGARAMALGDSLGQAATKAGVSGQKNAQTEFQAALKLRRWDAWQVVYEDICELEKKSRTAGVLDVADFCRLAVRWRARVEPQRGRA